MLIHIDGLTGIELLRPGSDPSINGPLRQVVVPAGGSSSVKFPLRINALDEVPIRVFAFASDASLGDAVERKVFVRVSLLTAKINQMWLQTRKQNQSLPNISVLASGYNFELKLQCAHTFFILLYFVLFIFYIFLIGNKIKFSSVHLSQYHNWLCNVHSLYNAKCYIVYFIFKQSIEIQCCGFNNSLQNQA